MPSSNHPIISVSSATKLLTSRMKASVRLPLCKIGRQNAALYSTKTRNGAKLVHSSSSCHMEYSHGFIRRRLVMFRDFRILKFSILFTATLFLLTTFAQGRRYNGFDLSNSSIPKKLIHSGGPGKDGIPSINKPRFVNNAHADFLKSDDRILGVTIDGIAKAYPVKILDRHEIVNDHFGDRKIVITYCPLCGSGIAFDADISGPKTFGVSGLLYNSDVLLFDRQTESLWSQIAMKAISGPMQDTALSPIPTRLTTWEKWRNEFPNSLVLSNKQGIYRPISYEREVYPGYETSKRIWFPIENKSDVLEPKARVIGLIIGDSSKAYPYETLKASNGEVQDTLAGKAINIKFDAHSNTATIYDDSGAELPGFSMYWFAWYAFNPKTEIYDYLESERDTKTLYSNPK